MTTASSARAKLFMHGGKFFSQPLALSAQLAHFTFQMRLAQLVGKVFATHTCAQGIRHRGCHRRRSGLPPAGKARKARAGAGRHFWRVRHFWGNGCRGRLWHRRGGLCQDRPRRCGKFHRNGFRRRCPHRVTQGGLTFLGRRRQVMLSALQRAMMWRSKRAQNSQSVGRPWPTSACELTIGE